MIAGGLTPWISASPLTGHLRQHRATSKRGQCDPEELGDDSHRLAIISQPLSYGRDATVGEPH